MSPDDPSTLTAQQRDKAEAMHLVAKDQADKWADWHYLNTTHLAETNVTNEGLASLTEAITNLDSEVYVRTIMAGEHEGEVLDYYRQFARAAFVQRIDQLLVCRTVSIGRA